MSLLKKLHKNYAVMVAGGTGGHIFAAIALGEALAAQGVRIHYFSGKRPLDYKLFAGKSGTHLDARPLKAANPIAQMASLGYNLAIFFTLVWRFWRDRPDFIFGAGGYVCGPVLMAGFVLQIPVFILEQNSVLGLTNKLLAPFATKIFTHFLQTRGLSERFYHKVATTGNPVRANFLQTTKIQEVIYQRLAQARMSGDPRSLNLLVFGGSLGAEPINELVYQLLESVDSSWNVHLHIKHQVGITKQDKAQIKPAHPHCVRYEQYPFLENILDYYQWADLIICRSGASSVSELRFLGRPVIFIPYPHHSDRHQYYNALFYAEEKIAPVEILSEDELRQNNFCRLQDIVRKNIGLKYKEALPEVTNLLNCKLKNPTDALLEKIEESL